MSASGLGAFLGRLVAHLDAAGIPHMVAGSVASSVHGEPRSTQDLDLVVDPGPRALDADYLDRWAAPLGVADLLEDARR